MSFRTNTYQQISLTDSVEGLTARERKALNQSWAKVFAEDIFPAINEKPFEVLYSDKASRPNTPVNICIGALIIKEVFGVSDDEVVESLMLDPRYQLALHTTSYEEQPISDKTLSRFRKRCYEYQQAHGIDLLRNCIKELGESVAKLMEISPRIQRMDTLMIAANIRKLTRVELLYTCVAEMVTYLKKAGKEPLIKGLERYADPNEFNRQFYYHKGNELKETLRAILNDGDKLLTNCGEEYLEIEEYQLLCRCFSEQTLVENGVRRLREKEDGGFHSAMLQNPSDPEATYRTKGKKGYVGYVANVEERVGKGGSAIIDYQYERNTYSDSQFLKDNLNRAEKSEEIRLKLTDGSFCGLENDELAAEKNIQLVHTNLSGSLTDEIFADFEFDERKGEVIRCPMGHKPITSCYDKEKRACRAYFSRGQCDQCPHKDRCKAKIHKRDCAVLITMTGHLRAKRQRFMGTEEFKLLARIRNGIETIPSLLRNQYHVDKMRARGVIRGGFFFGCKIGALNFRKLFTYRKGLGRYAPNPLLG